MSTPYELTTGHAATADSHFTRGASLHGQGQALAALAEFRKVLTIDPTRVQAHLAAATVLSELLRHDEALLHCRCAIELDGNDPAARANAGIACEALGLHDEALGAYGDALALDSSWLPALKNRGALLLALHRADDALANARQFAASHPQRADAHFQLGEACLATHRHAEAAAAFLKARPDKACDDIRPLLHEAFARAQLTDFNSAQRLLDQAWQQNPAAIRQHRRRIFSTGVTGDGPLDARTLYLLATFERAEVCDWRDGEHLGEQYAKILDNGIPPGEPAIGFRAAALGVPPASQLRLAKRIAADLPAPARPLPIKRGTRKKLRVGYLSADFREHPMGYLSTPLFGWHDRERVEVYTYSIGPSPDNPIRQQVRAGSDVFRDLTPLLDQPATNRIRADELDILIDMQGYTDFARPKILAQRPAPLQISWSGYVASTGAGWMDYIVLDPTTAPAGDEAFYSEAIIRLPTTLRFCGYADNSPPTPPPRASAGLPEHGRILAVFHNGYKIDPQVFSVWMRILAATPDGILWLADGKPEMTINLRNEASRHGIDPARLVFAPRLPHRDHLARFALADLFLDTFRYNGGATVCDALVAGVPVLTRAGAGYAQRMASSTIRAAGFRQGMTQSDEAYEATALAWLATPGKLAELRQQLQEQRDQASFYQPRHWVRQFEEALIRAAERQRAGLAPESFTLYQAA